MKTAPVRQNKKLAYLPDKKKKRLRLKLGTMLILFFALYFAVLFAMQYARVLQLRGTLAGIEREIGEVRRQNEEMIAEIERLQTPAYLEQMAREHLGMVRSGELLFMFRESDNLPADAP